MSNPPHWERKNAVIASRGVALNRDVLDGLNLEAYAAQLANRGYALTFGIHSRIDAFADVIRSAVAVGSEPGSREPLATGPPQRVWHEMHRALTGIFSGDRDRVNGVRRWTGR